jgi:hypothetical protein
MSGKVHEVAGGIRCTGGPKTKVRGDLGAKVCFV